MSRGGSGAVYDAERDSASLAALRVSLEGDAVAQVAALPADVAEVWSRYAALAAQWAARTDLTAARSAGALLEVLFVDALALLSARLIDDGAVRLNMDVATSQDGISERDFRDLLSLWLDRKQVFEQTIGF